MREATDGVDGLDSYVDCGGTIVDVSNTVLGLVSLSKSVNLLVDLDSVVVTLLTASSNCEADSRRMPSTNTSDLSETTMRLSGQFFGSPSAGYTLASVTLGDTNSVKVVVLSKDVTDNNLLLKESSSKVDLGTGVATVNLEFDDMGLLLSKREKLHLGVSDKSNNLAVFLDLIKSGFLAGLVVGPFLLVLAEGFSLGSGKVLVESSAGSIRNVLCPDGFECSEASGGFDVSDYANSDHWRSLDDGDWLDDFLLVEFGSLSGDLTDNVGHTSLVADESGEVAWLGSVILGVGLESTEVSSASLSGKESLGTVSRCFEFSVRHGLSVSST